MIPAKIPENETARLAELRRLELLDSECDAALEALTRTAKLALNAPMALVSLIDSDRQWFMCRIGVEVTQTPRELSFCAHAINTKEPFVVNNALSDARFAENPLVTGSPHIRAYLGMPLLTGCEYLALGSLCVIDQVARDWSERDVTLIRQLGRVASSLLEMRELRLDSMNAARSSVA